MDRASNMTASTGTGNVIAALASFFIPGLGQLVQGRVLAAAGFFVTTAVGYALYLLIVPVIIAALVHLWCIVDAARYRG
jgi:TM2 domain-containing membrane protein YozV